MPVVVVAVIMRVIWLAVLLLPSSRLRKDSSDTFSTLGQLVVGRSVHRNTHIEGGKRHQTSYRDRDRNIPTAGQDRDTTTIHNRNYDDNEIPIMYKVPS